MQTSKQISKVVFFSLFLLTAISVGAIVSEVLYESSGVSGFKLTRTNQGSRMVTRQSQDYDLYRRYTEQGGDELFLVGSAKTVQFDLDAEGVQGTVSWSVRKGPRLDQVLWGKTESATELNVHGAQPVLVSGLGGCCAEMTGYRLYDIETGRLLMSFNDFSWKEKVLQPYSIEVPNSPLRFRYVGILSQDSTRDRDFVAPVAGMHGALLLKYANEMLRQKVQVDIDLAEGFAPSVLEVKMEVDPSVPGSDKIEIQDNQIRFWNADGATTPAAISGVILKIVMDGGKGQKTLKIPIKNDRFDLSAAQIPAGVAIHSIVQSGIL